MQVARHLESRQAGVRGTRTAPSWPSERPGLQHHPGGRHFAPLLVGRGDHRAFQHRGMRGDGALHFDGRNILAAADDDVLLAVHDLDVALFVPHGHVAGVQPAVRSSRPRWLAAPCNSRPSRCRRASTISPMVCMSRGTSLHVQVDHADFAARHGPSGHGLAAQTVVFIGVCDGALRRAPGGHGAGLGEPVAGLARGNGTRAPCGPSARATKPRRPIMMLRMLEMSNLREFRAIQQHVGHGGDERHAGGALLLDEPEHLRRIEAAHHHLA